MNTCKTCVHHQIDDSRIQVGGARCVHPKLTEAGDDQSYTPDSLTYDYDEGGGFWTGDEFGCIHHEEKR